MFLEAILLAFVVALLRGGRLKQDFGLKLMWLAPLAWGLQLLNELFVPQQFQVIFTVVSYGCLLYFAVVNIENQGIRLILVGLFLNVLVIMANGGRIPVDIKAAERIGVDVHELVDGVAAKHQRLTSGARLPFLGDVVPIPFPIHRIISVGDIFAVVGVFLLVQDLMGKKIVLFRQEESEGS